MSNDLQENYSFEELAAYAKKLEDTCKVVTNHLDQVLAQNYRIKYRLEQASKGLAEIEPSLYSDLLSPADYKQIAVVQATGIKTLADIAFDTPSLQYLRQDLYNYADKLVAVNDL